jgi:hypothetical protein
MLDMFNIQNSNSSNVFVFNAMHGTNQNAWQTWDVPPNAKLLDMLVIGSGAGGGRSNAGTTGGGGGGAGSGIARLLIPAIFVPSRLYILVASGGRGAATNSSGGSSGYPSIVSTIPTGSSSGPFIVSSGPSATNGGGLNGAAGSATVASTQSPIAGVGIFSAIGGTAGSASPGAGAGTNVSTFNTHILTGGSGGGGKNVADTTGFAGGTITSSPFVLTTNVVGGTASSRDGDNGYRFTAPLCGTGGAGGFGAPGAVAGGRGGNGTIGCGGAGGGAGNPSGNGGNGGDGLVVITIWS